jgi:hypothetical protein
MILNLEAVEKKGWNIRYLVPEKLTEEICLAAVKQDGFVLRSIEI